ncbi:hypothetical protein [Melghirimyces algeriensis]|uniref:Uncharacterized protein n=1 Tax=Melghirimyces algeriensis TaxID=910412 RepID=A0A521C4T8_9BACL|nr:hypothetical protein [Melghirimyces algeriensis]SMO54442.1 hypothetical protein SAMN06264849_103127 [Melghirimyces algeriensis]
MKTYPIQLTLGQIDILYEVSKLEIAELKDQQKKALAQGVSCWGPEQMERLQQWTEIQTILVEMWHEAFRKEIAP